MNERVNVIFEDQNLLVADKPPGTVPFYEGQEHERFLIDILAKDRPYLKETGKPPRFGVVHRLDKETSGIILIAKNDKAFSFFQKEFGERRVIKEYIALCVGKFKEDEGVIETNIGRSPKDRRKQKAFPLYDPKNPRIAITRYKVLKKFKNYTKILVIPETGRKHQIRCHLSHIKHPIAGDDLYGFRNQPRPKDLDRQFLHAYGIRIKLPGNDFASFKSELPEDLKNAIENIKHEQ